MIPFPVALQQAQGLNSFPNTTFSLRRLKTADKADLTTRIWHRRGGATEKKKKKAHFDNASLSQFIHPQQRESNIAWQGEKIDLLTEGKEGGLCIGGDVVTAITCSAVPPPSFP